MDDHPLVLALAAGDARGLAGAYREYGDRLYTYCRGMLGDQDAAADAVHDTFVVACQRIGQLREPDRLRSWLYAIARNECLRQLRGQSRRVSLAEAGEVTAAEPDPAGGMRAADVQVLVWSAAETLDPADREVFELATRHGLAVPEIAAVLGVPAGTVETRLSRARAQLAESLGAAVVDRYAAVPVLPAPAALWPRLELKCFDPGLELEREVILRRAGRFDRGSGFPVPLDLARRRRRFATSAAAAVLAALVVAGASALVWPTDPAREPPQALPTSSAPASPTPATSAADRPSARPTESPTPSPTESPTPSPTEPAESPEAPTVPSLIIQPDPLEISVDGGVECALLACWVEATVTANKQLETAQLIVTNGAGNPEAHPMEIDGRTASGTGPVRSPDGEWWVEVTAGDERAESQPTPVAE
ncbi:MAG TPA: sigma-70 family RNA polymerase sigma factor [Natronosporangium sp.]